MKEQTTFKIEINEVSRSFSIQITTRISNWNYFPRFMIDQIFSTAAMLEKLGYKRVK
jgi:hypothetical protein